ncbi:ParB/RepB/Spo0J family partition protein [Streptomyces sp. NPDC059070]|uniref:ParB/RepB/Spo0J family partition protein n=1 Tax=Streptomyces sp. NPDC059070 TaxID=3346713 RepID=UPI0036D149F3
MKKSEMLGNSATFAAVAQPMSSRAASFARFSGQDNPTTNPPSGAEIASLRLPLDQLAHNPYNPREQLKAVEDLADSLTSRGVIQPLTVVTRTAFLDAHPSHEERLGAAEYVVVDGNRRLAAAKLAGLDDAPVHIDDTLADSADTLLETALIAAVQHEDLDPLDEAKALERLVEVHGSQRAVARVLGKSSPWVTQRLALLKLTPELQQAVEEKALPVEVARNVGRLPAQQQHRAAEDALAERSERQRSRKKKSGANAVGTPATTGEPQAGANAVSASAATPTSETDSTQTHSTDQAPASLDAVRKVVRMPWHDGSQVADIVIDKMDAAQREVLIQRLLAARAPAEK